jgi:hypothetical protein
VDDGPVLHGPEPHDLEGHARRVVELVRLGRMAEADRHIAAHAELAERSGDPLAQRDAAVWKTMRALADGRYYEARASNEAVRSLGEAGNDPDGWAPYWAQRYWIVLESGTEEERAELLDFCRQRSYWQDDLCWRGALTLLLARLGYEDEAGRELEIVVEKCLGRPQDDEWLDIMTSAGETAYIVGDGPQARVLYRALNPFSTTTAMVGKAWVCKGPTSRVLDLLAVTRKPTGRRPAA